MKVLITGARGFIGSNLRPRLRERKDIEIACFDSSDDVADLPAKLEGVGFVFHLAGVNRPQDPVEFVSGNYELTQVLCTAVTRSAESADTTIPILFSSSIQADRENDYGRSKRTAEEAMFAAARRGRIKANVFRLPNVFGKWCRPNYNSAVATFCHNLARDLPVQVHDANAPLTLVYVDDVVERFINVMDGVDTSVDADGFATMTPQYATTVGKVADIVRRFKESRDSLTMEPVGTGLLRALYSTYVSYLPTESFSYQVAQHTDPRGSFVEMLKTTDSGQFSYFTAHPGVTRGGHYHHTKTEKFLVIKGTARFKFRHMETGETHEIITEGGRAEIVETVPGWTHDITNIGKEELIVMLWANEIFDRARPDTYAAPL